MTLELQQLCQRIQDEQGYLVIASIEKRAIGTVARNIQSGNFLGNVKLPTMVVVGQTSSAEYKDQATKYFPSGEWPAFWESMLFYQMVAE